jgi:predicted AlkP superfamily phosphohydrolase/phosphomutase
VRPGPEAERLLEEIEAALYDLADPDTGAPVVERVYRGADLYHGAMATAAPDLVVAWRDGYYSMAGMAGPDAPIFQGHLTWPDSQVVHSAEHRLHGVLLAYGPHVVPGIDLEETSIVDLAPTLVHLLGLPVPGSMEGRVLAELFDLPEASRLPTEAVTGRAEVGWQSPYSPEEEALVQRRLRDLGYLD